jgi:hypothetical protein
VIRQELESLDSQVELLPGRLSIYLRIHVANVTLTVVAGKSGGPGRPLRE